MSERERETRKTNKIEQEVTGTNIHNEVSAHVDCQVDIFCLKTNRE